MERIKMVYACIYDGKLCEQVIPKFDDDGYLIPESNKELFEKYGHTVTSDVLESGWDICDNCPRNFSMGHPYGKLKCEGFSIDNYL